ncbi:hypothetical protein F4776DRAFT_670634 [Hypoxylon sp. NC0597]|nr:hypothetical protein F4776DRAFT_670634 [Hypoxylon sp. NC0597]
MEQVPRAFLSVRRALFSLLESLGPPGRNPMIDQTIIMKSTNHPGITDTYTMPESMGSVLTKTISMEANYEYEGGNDDNNTNQPCVFLKSVVDDCYKSRLYARIFEYYFVENNPELFKSCRCPMENCPQRSFTHPKPMLLHLKNCKFFSQGLFRCPTCNDAEKFQTTSHKKCSWNREKFSQKVQRVVKAKLKSITSPRLGSKLPSEHCKDCGRSLRIKGPHDPFIFPEIPSRPCSTSPIFDASSFTIPIELPTSCSLQELVDTSPRPELQADSPIKGYKEPPPSPTYQDEAHGVLDSVSDMSSSSKFPSIKTLSPASTSGIDSAGLSPAITPESFMSTSTGHTLPSDYFGRIDFASDIQAGANGNGYVEQPRISLQRPRSTLIYDAPSTFDSVVLQSSFNRMGSPGGRGCTLSLQTPGLNLNCPPWIPYQENTVNPMNCGGQLNLRNSPPQSSVIETPLLSDFRPHLDSSIAVKNADAAELLMPFTDSSPLGTPLDSFFPPSSSDLPPDQEPLAQDFKCPKCDFLPNCRPKGFRASLRKHMETHTEKSHKCLHCPKMYKRADNLKAHVDKKHRGLGGLKRRQRSSDSLGLRSKRTKKGLCQDMGQEVMEPSQ